MLSTVLTKLFGSRNPDELLPWVCLATSGSSGTQCFSSETHLADVPLATTFEPLQQRMTYFMQIPRSW
jgi:hypothetical protein